MPLGLLLQPLTLDSQVDGNTTLGENLADHGGLSMALEAYNQWRMKNRDHRLPALPFDDMQLFFIGIIPTNWKRSFIFFLYLKVMHCLGAPGTQRNTQLTKS